MKGHSVKFKELLELLRKAFLEKKPALFIGSFDTVLKGTERDSEMEDGLPDSFESAVAAIYHAYNVTYKFNDVTINRLLEKVESQLKKVEEKHVGRIPEGELCSACAIKALMRISLQILEKGVRIAELGPLAMLFGDDDVFANEDDDGFMGIEVIGIGIGVR